MATLQIYLISNTAGDSSFAVQPQTFNGPGGVQQTTDLTLYGNGAPNWGQEFNENFFRLLENWAVGAKIELPGTNPVDQPLNANDIGGTDVGINHPVRGQTWFNTSSGYLFAYDGSEWQLTNIRKGTAAPSNPAVGALWFDTGNTRLKTWDGSAWVAHVKVDGDTMTGNLTIPDATAADHALNRQTADSRYVEIDGDTMTGLLTLSGAPTNANHAATKDYVDTRDLTDLNNVNASPSDGDLLTYNASANEWQQTAPAKFQSPTGVLFPFAGDTGSVPTGWLLCNGQQVSRTTYSSLFNIIGTAYGIGDGSSTFNVPDLRDRFPLGTATMGGTDTGRVDNYSTGRGDTGGADQHQLTEAEMPSHDHDVTVNFWGNPTASTFNDRVQGSSTAAGTYTASDALSQVGGDEAHNNMPPFVTFNFIIKT